MTHYYSRFLSLILIWLALPAALALAQNQLPAPMATPQADLSLQFIETKNRIGHEVQYEAAVQGGKLFLHPDKFTYSFIDRGDSHHHGAEAVEAKKGHSTEEPEKAKGHAFSVTFVGANKATLKPSQRTKGHYNYYLGNDQSKWVSGAKGYRQIDYDNLYPGIDMRLHEQNGKLKYEFFLEKGANPAIIKMKYDGAEKLELKNGELVVTTSINTVTEGRPYTYQIVNGEQKPVACNFRVTGTEVSFDFPDGYDADLPLVIDPVLTYSTYSGSSVDNWGFTATFDSVGNIYSGGIIFGNGFPTTLGPSYDLTFNGVPNSFPPTVDVCIQKFNPNATGAASLEYVTYLGGAANEAPHSLVVNNQNELLVLGSTGSLDYPVTAGAYDVSFAGGPIYSTHITIGHAAGSDIFISKLNASGTSLLASTFIGGTGNDGVLADNNPLTKNYGDQFRGDIITDANDNIYIVSTTSSNLNFPVVNGFQATYGGGVTDAVVCKLSPTLNTMIWSSYLGGSSADAGFSIQVDSLENVFVCGGTQSANFPASATSHKPTYGNNGDGFIARISNDGSTLQRATFIGTSSYDQTYFVQLDNNQNVYVLGQTQGVYPVTAGTFSVANSKQFIHALDYDLNTTVFSTTFGSPDGQVNISPTAFLVNECDRIYVAGWGGSINWMQPTYVQGTTLNMPLTANATQTVTNGNGFYLMQLAQNASALDFATYIGDNLGGYEHVDGGTSRFDKRGNVYHAVCACGAGNQFPTTPNAWSQTNQSGNCNNAAFKYAIPELAADFIPSVIPNGPRETQACHPATFYFRRVHSGGISYLWDFGDNTTSTSPGPLSHNYPAPGSYVVTLTITDSSTCVITDMAIDTVHVLETTGEIIQSVIRCKPYAVQLEASGGSSYSWFPTAGLSDPTVPDPIAEPDSSTTYSVEITNSIGCKRILTVDVDVIEEPILVNLDSAGICRGQSAQLSATPGHSYVWSPNYQLSSTSIANPIASPDSTVTYTVQIDAGGGCVHTKYIEVEVNDLPEIQMPQDTSICFGDSVMLQVLANGQYTYSWSPAVGLSDATIANPIANPASSTWYHVQVSNGNCAVRDSVYVGAVPGVGIQTPGIAVLCLGDSVQLESTMNIGFDFEWTPATGLDDPTSLNPVASPLVTTTYYLSATGFGCDYVNTDSVVVQVKPYPEVQMPADTSLCSGSSAMLTVTGSPEYSYLWSPATGLSDTLAANPVANPAATTVYTLLTNLNGCETTETVTVEILQASAASAGPDVSVCNPAELVTLSAEQQPGSSYQWLPADGLSSPTEPVTTASPLVTTAYFLAVTGSNGCTSFDTVLVNVSQPPVLVATPELPEGIAPYPINFTNQTTGGSNYTWNFGNGTTSTDLNPAANYQTEGTYYVMLTATYGQNCSITDTVAMVRVIPPFVPNIITPNGDGINDVFVPILTNEPLHLEIYNRWGKLLYKNSDYKSDWGGDGVPHGIYYYQLSTPSGGSWKGWLEIVK